MGDLFKKLDDLMTGDLVRKVGGFVCLFAIVIIGLGFMVGLKSVLNTMKGPAVAVEAADEDAAEDEASSEDVEEDVEEDEEDYDE